MFTKKACQARRIWMSKCLTNQTALKSGCFAPKNKICPEVWDNYLENVEQVMAAWVFQFHVAIKISVTILFQLSFYPP
jgi:hypothetical protein